MEGFQEIHLTVKNINSSNKQVVSIEELFKNREKKGIFKIGEWSPDGWNKITEIKKERI